MWSDLLLLVVSTIFATVALAALGTLLVGALLVLTTGAGWRVVLTGAGLAVLAGLIPLYVPIFSWSGLLASIGLVLGLAVIFGLLLAVTEPGPEPEPIRKEDVDDSTAA